MDYLDKILTKKQYEIYKMSLDGYKNIEIGEMLGFSRQNVSQSLLASKRKIEKYNGFIRDGMQKEEAIREVHRKSGSGSKEGQKKEVVEKSSDKKGIRGRKAGSGKLINYLGEDKTFIEWCKEFGINYSTAYQRYQKGLPLEKVFGKGERIDYTIKEEYDLSLISDEYRYILEQKNAGKSFSEIARVIGQTPANVQTKAKAAINKLQGKEADKTAYMRKRHNELKNNEEYMKKKREYARKWYKEHLEQERERGKRRSEKRREERIKNGEVVKERTDYTIKEEYNLSLISDECKEILVRKNNGESFVSISNDLGCTPASIRAKAKTAIDILQSKKLSRKICRNCGKNFYANGNSAKYCDDCKNGKIYMPGHEGEEYGELKVDAVYRHKDDQYAECTCSCGKKCEIRYNSIKSGKTTSCGHVNQKNLFTSLDLTGKTNKYGLKALYKTGKKDGTCYVWRCLCTCGKEFDVATNDFKIRKSCGHLQEESRENNIKMAKRVYDEYSKDGTNALVITSKIPQNNTSGFKGVKRRTDRETWTAEIIFKGKRYYLGDYYYIEDAAEVRKIAEEHTHKDFLRWFSEEFPLLYKKISDKVEISEKEDLKRIREIRKRNRKNREWVLEYDGQKKTLIEWCAELGMDYDCIRQRIKVLGWSVKKAFETPVRKSNNKAK